MVRVNNLVTDLNDTNKIKNKSFRKCKRSDLFDDLINCFFVLWIQIFDEQCLGKYRRCRETSIWYLKKSKEKRIASLLSRKEKDERKVECSFIIASNLVKMLWNSKHQDDQHGEYRDSPMYSKQMQVDFLLLGLQ